MQNKWIVFLLAFSFLHGVNYPFPTHNTYHAGVIKPNIPQATMDQKVEQLYDQWKQAYLTTRAGHPDQMYVFYNADGTSYPENAVSVSEGHGYGMMLAALMAGYDPQAQTIFDNLFRYYVAFPSSITAPLMGWQQVDEDGEIVPNPEGGDDSATDGDMDIAYALLLADKQWGSNNGPGSIDYLSHAREMMTGMVSGDICIPKSTLRLGDWVNDYDTKFRYATRPSDFMLNHLRTFSAESGDATWDAVLNKTYLIINQLFENYSPQTGLLPDFSEFVGNAYIPARQGFLERAEDGYYSWNSCRTPWRIATDYILTGDERALGQLTQLNSWIRSKANNTPSQVKPGYKLDGTPYPVVSYTSIAFTTPFAVSAMISAENQTWLNSLWTYTSQQSTSSNNYFGNWIETPLFDCRIGQLVDTRQSSG